MMNKASLKDMIDNGFVHVNKHPTHDLFTYNYTPKAQYERVWNDITLACRGLILDGDSNIKATSADLKAQFEAIENQCKMDFKTLATRKESAIYFQTCAYPSVLFKMLDEKPYNGVIWKQIRPKFEKPFSKIMNSEV